MGRRRRRGGRNTKEKARDEKQGDRGDSDKGGDEEGREMKLKSDNIKGRGGIFLYFFMMILSHCRKGGGSCENLITWQSRRPVNEGCVSILSSGGIKEDKRVCGVRVVKVFSCRSCKPADMF